MRSYLAALALATAALAACGGDSDTEATTAGTGTAAASTVTTSETTTITAATDVPAVKRTGSTTGTVAAPDQATAERWCDALQAGDGTVPAGVNQVSLDLAGTGSDVTCMLP